MSFPPRFISNHVVAAMLSPSGRGTTRREGQRAFTLIELLVVITIIGVLVSTVLPVFNLVRRTTDKVTCTSNLRQIVAASNLAATDNNGNYLNLHGYPWEQGQTWIADGLAPYLGGTVGQDPTKVLRCPAASKNQQEAWLEASQYAHYRFNIWYAQNKKPLCGYANAMLFFDTTYPDWTQSQYAHFPGGGALMNVAYADGHIVPLAFADYRKLNPSSDETQNDFFQLGWLK